jgi:SNF2 family DNA or RNA helicase
VSSYRVRLRRDLPAICSYPADTCSTVANLPTRTTPKGYGTQQREQTLNAFSCCFASAVEADSSPATPQVHGPSAASGMSTSSDTGAASYGLDNHNRRLKRSYSRSQDDDPFAEYADNKIKRRTPSPMPLAFGTYSPAGGNLGTAPEVIDLTGDEYVTSRLKSGTSLRLTLDLSSDDVEIVREQEIQMQGYRRNKAIADGDAALARQLQEGYPLSPHAPSASQADGSSRPSAFDRITNRTFLSRPSSQTSIIPVASSGPIKREQPTFGSPGFPPAAFLRDGWTSPQQGVAKPEPGLGRLSTGTQPPFSQYQMPGAFPEDPTSANPLSGWPPGSGNLTALPPGHPYHRYSPLPYPPSRLAHPDQHTASIGSASSGQASSLAGTSSVLPQPYPQNASMMRPGMYVGGSYGALNRLARMASSWASPSSYIKSDSLASVINGMDSNPFNYPSFDPGKSAAEIDQDIKNLLQNIGGDDEEAAAENREGTPDALRYPLYPHQQIALKWMKKMEEGTNKGGILSDDMGLGKTISTLSLMVSRPSEKPSVKTNLIVGPVALLRQWEREIQTKLKPNYKMSVYVMHGVQRKQSFEDLRLYDIVLTTYGTIAAEWKRLEKYKRDHDGEAFDDNRELAKKCPILHGKSKWYRVILDESQFIKNINAQCTRAAHDIVATHRWCLTGTPMMNGVHELFPLIKFLRITPYNEQTAFNKAFSSLNPKNSARADSLKQNRAMKQLQVVIKAIMLRRMKSSVVDGKPIVQLPPKTEDVDHVVFSADELSFYQTLESKSRVIVSKYLREGTVGKNYSNILTLLLRLRQACCHPHLNLDFDVVTAVAPEEMIGFAKNLSADAVARIRDVEAFECPVCLDATLNPLFVLPCGHQTCAECHQKLKDHNQEDNIRNGDEQAGPRSSCPSCRGQIDLTQIFDYRSFVKVHMLEKAVEEGFATPDAESDEESVTDSEYESDFFDPGDWTPPTEEEDEVNENGDLKDFVVPDTAEESDSDWDSMIKREEKKLRVAPGSQIPSGSPSQPAQHDAQRKMKKGKAKVKVKKVMPGMLKKLRAESTKNIESRRRYMHYLRKNWQPSAKVTKACELIDSLRDSGEKIIVFSVFTLLLDLLEIPIKHELHIKHARYDGSMTTPQRERAVNAFMEDKDTKVILVSLRAGNAGLNLTAASQVIIMDPFWNPYVEMQAIDRAYRIGQQRPVQVHRILVEQTVEDRILELQEKKRAMVDTALDEGEMKSITRLGVRDLRFLFDINN